MNNHHNTPVQPGESLGDWITACDGFLALSREAMREVGPAAQTLGAVYALTGGHRGGQTRESLDTIAQQATLPKRTVQTHVSKLVEAGWLESLGRGLLPRSTHRRYRTVTLKLTRHAVDLKEPFWMLPRWAATRLRTWSERALFAYLCSAWKLVETIEIGGLGCADGREFRKPSTILKDTGLTLPSIRSARDKLRRAHLIDAYEGDWSMGEATELAANTEYILKRSDVAKPVTRKPRARHPSTRRRRVKHEPSMTEEKPAPSHEKSCAIPMKKAARTPEKTCAIPPQKPARTPEKTCHPHGREPMDKTIGKNLGNKLPGKNSGQEHGCRRAADHFRVHVPSDAILAAQAFRAMGYRGTDGAIVWKAACWRRAGILTGEQFASAYNGVRVIEPTDAVAYFRSILKETLGEARLKQLERRTTLPRGFVPGPFTTDLEDRRERCDEGMRPRQPERMSRVLERAMKRLHATNATELAEGKADLRRELDEASKQREQGAA